MFTGREEWFVPCENEIKNRMRYYYTNKDKIDRMAGLTQADKFSYDNIGNQIKEYLGA